MCHQRTDHHMDEITTRMGPGNQDTRYFRRTYVYFRLLKILSQVSSVFSMSFANHRHAVRNGMYVSKYYMFGIGNMEFLFVVSKTPLFLTIHSARDQSKSRQNTTLSSCLESNGSADPHSNMLAPDWSCSQSNTASLTTTFSTFGTTENLLTGPGAMLVAQPRSGRDSVYVLDQ
jgi:hypothetical protein